MSFAANAAMTASSPSALSSVNARDTRASGLMYKKGVIFADNAPCGRRHARRQGLSIAGCGLSNTRRKSANSIPNSAGRG